MESTAQEYSAQPTTQPTAQSTMPTPPPSSGNRGWLAILLLFTLPKMVSPKINRIYIN